MAKSSRTNTVLAVVVAAFVLLAGAVLLINPGSDTSPETPLQSPDLELDGQRANSSKPVRFTASGDFSASAAAQSVFDQIDELDPDLHLALGDFSYGETETEQAWCDMVTDAVGDEFPFELLAGDHESNGKDGHIDEFTECLPNRLPGLQGNYGRQWYVDVPQQDPLVRFVMISPGIPFDDNPLGMPNGNDPLAVPFGADTQSYDAGSKRYQWTADAIDGARESSIPWVVVGMHTPCISLGEYECTPGADINNLLLDKDVDLVLHGDEHLYQRTHQLATGGRCERLEPGEFSAECMADDDAQMVQGNGTVFVTAGTGGRSLRDVHENDPEASYFATASGADRNPTFGSLEVRITPDELVGHFGPAAGGDFTDTFVIRDGG